MKLSNIATSLALALALLAAGCATPSIYGFDKAVKLVQDKELLGTWVDQDGAEWQVKDGKGKTYEVVVTPPKKEEEALPVQLTVSMAELGGRRLIDVRLNEAEMKEIGDRYGPFVLPAHQFARLDVDTEGLKIYWLKEGWMEDWPGVLDWEGAALMTAEPKALAHILATAALDEKAWDGQLTLRRK